MAITPLSQSNSSRSGSTGRAYICMTGGEVITDRSRVLAVYTTFKAMDSKHVESVKEGHICMDCAARRGLDPDKLIDAERRIANSTDGRRRA